MKKKIAILGSTGSIGKTTINLLKKNKNKYEIKLLSTNKNVKALYNQSLKLKVKNVIIFDEQKYQKNKRFFLKKKINVFSNFDKPQKILKSKVDITISGISGLNGLKPLLSSIKISKKIAVANKESIICGWHLIKKELKKNRTDFIPIDSEHFSIWKLIENSKNDELDTIYLTASGGPFLNKKLKKIKNIHPNHALKHPNWKMGKKITIDSATMMNKVFEVIEAKKIFNLDIKKIKVLIHPSSYVHSVIKFKNGVIKLLAHDTNMMIPIGSAIFNNYEYNYKTKILDIDKINKIQFLKPKISQFPVLKFLNQINNNDDIFEIILIAANDELVNYYLEQKIKYSDIYTLLNKIIKKREFMVKSINKKLNLREINEIVEIVKSKVRKLVYQL